MNKLRESAQAMITAWEDGEHIHKHFFRDLRDALAEPDEVLAEREACAQVVEQYCGAWDDEGFALAQEIRARGEEDKFEIKEDRIHRDPGGTRAATAIRARGQE